MGVALVLGGGRLAALIADELRSRGYAVTAAAGLSPDAGVPDAVFVLSGAAAPAELVAEARRRWKDAFIIAAVRSDRAAAVLKRAGADTAVPAGAVVARAVIREMVEHETTRRAHRLAAILDSAKAGGVGIFLHDAPDPDALASAFALKVLCESRDIGAEIYHGGAIQRRANRMMVEKLGIPLVQLRPGADVLKVINLRTKIALLDSAQSSENNILPREAVPNIVIDHHLSSRDFSGADFCDVQTTVGAASTILTRYLQELGVRVESELATALLYGIRVDTRLLTRNVSPADLSAATFLSQLADKDLVWSLESTQTGGETMRAVAAGVAGREMADGVALCFLGPVSGREVVAEAADIMAGEEGLKGVVAAGVSGEHIYISARAAEGYDVAALLQRAITGLTPSASAGGHAVMAGAQVPLAALGGAAQAREALMRRLRAALQ